MSTNESTFANPENPNDERKPTEENQEPTAPPQTQADDVTKAGEAKEGATQETTINTGAGTEQEQAAEQRPAPRRRGFAAMDRDRVKEIASKGGRAAHAAGTAHQFNSDEARVAGKKGGMAPHVRRGGVRRRPNGDNTAVKSQTNQGQNDGRS